jgi:PAS domain S-box-containing protein
LNLIGFLWLCYTFFHTQLQRPYFSPVIFWSETMKARSNTQAQDRRKSKAGNKVGAQRVKGRQVRLKKPASIASTQVMDLIERISDGFVALDAQMNYIYVNQRAGELLGRQPGELIGKNYWDEFPEARSTPFANAYLQALETQAPVLLEDYYAPWDRWFENRIYPSKGGISILFTEITERKKTDEQLRYQAHLLSNINDAIMAADKNYILTAWNQGAQKIYGWTANEVLGRNGLDLLQSEFVGVDADRMRQQIAEQGGFVGEATQLRKDGVRIAVEIASIVLRDDKEQITGYVSVNRDITERKQAEEQIQKQLRRLHALRMIDIAISSSFDVHIVLNIVLQYAISQLGVDASAVLLLAPHRQTIEYASSRGVQSHVIQQTQIKLSNEYAGHAVIERATVHVVGPIGTDNELAKALHLANARFVDYYGTPLIVKGELKGVLETYHRTPLNLDREQLDFLETLARQASIAIENSQLFQGLQRANTELEKRVAERTAELQQLNLELQYASRAKGEFLAAMSHDLRTPLNNILSVTEFLLEQRSGTLNELQQTSVHTIESSGQHLLELINDISDVSRIDAGRFEIQPQMIDVTALCQSSLAFVREQAARKSIALHYIEDQAVPRIHADPLRLKQILVNLLTNAVKFTSSGGQVTLQVHADTAGDRIQFSVTDTGVGIAPDDLDRLFRPFEQVDKNPEHRSGGTGLGLALIQRLTDLHGGSLHVESETGKGSRFAVNLLCGQDLWASHEDTQQDHEVPVHKELPASEPHKRATLLLAEDNEASVLTIREYLESHGYEVIVAYNGLEARGKAEQVKPDLILMDIQMPVMNGLDAIAHLRADSRFSSTPIIALTALTVPGDRERCFQAGANEYLSKPLSLKLLMKTIETLLKLPGDLHGFH